MGGQFRRFPGEKRSERGKGVYSIKQKKGGMCEFHFGDGF